MRFSPLAALSMALLALGACERKAPADAPAPQSEAVTSEVAASEVAAADAFGVEGETVSAVAFWSHPSINFEGMLLAADAAGVKAYRVETGEAVSSVEQSGIDALSVVYFGQGPTAEGIAIASRPGGYDFYIIDNATGALSGTGLEANAPRTGAFCAGGSAGAPALYEISAAGLSRRTLEKDAAKITLGDPAKISTERGASCHVDIGSGAVIVIADDGAVRRVDPQTGESFGLAFAPRAPDASALFPMAAPTPGAAPGGALLLLDGASGVVNLIDLVDGHALGAVKIKSTFDLDAVTAASGVSSGYGNYGGVYRDGAVAIITAGAGAPIRLAPWNGVLDALSLTPGTSVDPRAPQAAADTGTVIDIDLVQP